MSYTKAGIFNLTLKNLGISTNIQSENQTDKNTVVLNDYYETAKQQVLKDYDWSFATAYRELTPTIYRSLDFRFQFEYDYPNDCVRAREIVNQRGLTPIEFEVATNITGARVIHTNAAPATLCYTISIPSQEQYFTSEFALAFSWYLAFLASSAITGARAKTSDCMTIYTKIISKAKTDDANERYINSDCTGDWFEL